MISYIRDFISGDIELVHLLVYIGSICFVVFCATPLHEYAHALIAVKLGDDTPVLRGRLTINPKAHIDPIGLIMIFLFGFGYAKPVEVRMRKFKKPKRDMALVALAGPVCNILQALVCMFLYAGFISFSNNSGNETLFYISLFFFYAANINVNLGVFNLLPIPPLDGSKILNAVLPAKIYFKILQYERYVTIALFVLLFTGILSTPILFLSGVVMNALQYIAFIPFGFLIG